MRIERRHENCPRTDKPSPWNPTPGLMRAAFITLGERKHRVGYVCLDCGYFEFNPDFGWLIALRQRQGRRQLATRDRHKSEVEGQLSNP